MKFVDEGTKITGRNNRLIKSHSGSPNLSHLSYADIQRLQIVANFVHDLFPQQTCHVKKSYVGGWLWQVPTILRQNTTLDFAAEALASIYFAKRTGSPEKTDAAMMRSSEIYLRAIELLSKALRNPKSCFSSEILCACLLLVHYEVRPLSEQCDAANTGLSWRGFRHWRADRGFPMREASAS